MFVTKAYPVPRATNITLEILWERVQPLVLAQNNGLFHRCLRRHIAVEKSAQESIAQMDFSKDYLGRQSQNYKRSPFARYNFHSFRIWGTAAPHHCYRKWYLNASGYRKIGRSSLCFSTGSCWRSNRWKEFIFYI